MAYAAERDDVRAEVRKDSSGTLAYWVKALGLNATASTAYYSIFDSDGAAIQAEAAATITAVSGVGSRLDLTIPAISSYQDGARIDLRFTVSTVEYYDTILFDVVKTPWLSSGGVSLNDLREERPDIDEIMDRIGVRLGYTTGDTAQTQAAAIYAYRGRAVLDSWLRGSASEVGKLRAALIVDRRALNRVERYLALNAIFAGLSQNPIDGTDESGALARYYEGQARAAYASITLSYDSDEDGTADSKPRAGGVVYRRRVQ